MSFSSRVGPPSPPSPHPGSQKDQHQPGYPSELDHIPQTPTSPPLLMSISAQNYASSLTSSQTSPSQATSTSHSSQGRGGPNLASPSSSAPMSTQPSQHQTVTATNSFPTPASSVNGYLIGGSGSAEESEQASKPISVEARRAQAQAPAQIIPRPDGTMDSSIQAEHRRTNHERQSGHDQENVFPAASNSVGSVPAEEDAMDVDERIVSSLGERNAELESLRKEFSSPFHLCRGSYAATGPDPSIDLISLYGLGPVAKSVARIDPVTGEKINRLRKSYEGKLKGLGLAGRNKPVKHDPGAPGGLRHLTMWPEEEWQNQKVSGKEIKVADLDSTLHKLQKRAMKMEPGSVPNNEYWEDVLGHEKPLKHTGPSVDLGKQPIAAVGTPRPTAAAQQPNGQPAVAESELRRASRGRKRHYDENSFVGYGEGYADDDDDPAFYSNSEGIGKKRRKKDHVSKVSTPVPDRGGSYGVGMFGIGAR